MLYKERNEAIKFSDDYFLMVSVAKSKATKGKGLKIVTPKQILQKLSISLAQSKAGSNSKKIIK